MTVLANDSAHLDRIIAAVSQVEGLEVEHVSDRTFLLHLGGKLEVTPRTPLKTRDDLSMASPLASREFRAQSPRTLRRSGPSRSSRTRLPSFPMEPPCSDSATLGPRQPCPSWRARRCSSRSSAASMPFRSVSRPKMSTRSCARSSRLAGLRRHQPRGHLRAALLRDRAPLRHELDIPVFHDDQHGTAIVVLAALLNALRVVGKRLEDVRIVVTGWAPQARRRRGHSSPPERETWLAATARGRSTADVRALTPEKAAYLNSRIRVVCGARPTRRSRGQTCTSGSPRPAR